MTVGAGGGDRRLLRGEQGRLHVEKPSREMRHILISLGRPAGSATARPSPRGVTEADWATGARHSRRSVRRRLVAGGDWTELASEYSGDFGSKDSGGELGPSTWARPSGVFEDAAFRSSWTRYPAGQDRLRIPHHPGHVHRRGRRARPWRQMRSQIESQLLSEARRPRLEPVGGAEEGRYGGRDLSRGFAAPSYHHRH